MHKVRLLVRCLEDGEITAAYVKEMELPFVPQIGMKFERGPGSTYIWITEDDKGLTPKIEDMVYDIDEEVIVCLFTVNQKLAATFWEKIELEMAEARFIDCGSS